VIKVRGLHKHFGDLHVLKNIHLDVSAREVVVLIGSSGSGKSTLLRCLNFLERKDKGEIWLMGRQIEPDQVNLNQIREQVGMVFQHFHLFPI
jgi:polar amino acid transport system ATP-binding protein